MDYGAVIRCHSFEDHQLKFSSVTIGDRATIMAGAKVAMCNVGEGQCYAQRASLGKDTTLKLAQFIRERLQKSQVWSSSAVAEGQQGKFYIVLSLYSATNTLPFAPDFNKQSDTRVYVHEGHCQRIEADEN